MNHRRPGRGILRLLVVTMALMSLVMLPATVDAARRSREVMTFVGAVSFNCSTDANGNEECNLVQLEAYHTVSGDAVCVGRIPDIDGTPAGTYVEYGCLESAEIGLNVDPRLTHAVLEQTIVPVRMYRCGKQDCYPVTSPYDVTVEGTFDGIGKVIRQRYAFFDQFGPCAFAFRGLDVLREAKSTFSVDGTTISAEFAVMARSHQSLNFFNDCMPNVPVGR